MSDARISELPTTTEVTGREIFVCARDSENWGVLLEQIRGRFIFPEDFGAVGDGESDDSAALLAASRASVASGKALILAGGTYRVSSDLDIEAPIHFLGGRLSIDTGVVLAIAGRICAPPEQIFFGRITGRLDAAEVMPEWFGAKGGSYDTPEPPDDTEALQAAIDAAGGQVLRLTALYWVQPERITFGNVNAGLHVVGHSGASIRGPGGAGGRFRLPELSGLALLDDGDWMVRLGSTQRGEHGFNQFVMQDVIFDGNHRRCHLGLLWVQNVSQAKFDRVAVRNTRGPGVFANKFEDVTITNSQFGKLGDLENRWGYLGGIVFGAPPKFASIGSNVVFFHACRFEWFDGGYFRVTREPAADPDYNFNNNSLPYVHHLILNQCKVEVGRTNEDGEVYGESRSRWAVFEFGDAINGIRENGKPRWVNNIQINGCHFNGLHHARTIARVGTAEGFAMRGNNLTFAGYGQNPQSLFELMDNDGNDVDCKTFVFKDNQTWVKDGAEDLTFTHVDRSRYQIHFEPPLIPVPKA